MFERSFGIPENLKIILADYCEECTEFELAVKTPFLSRDTRYVCCAQERQCQQIRKRLGMQVSEDE